jgi:ATP-dependent helicase HrpA
MQRQNRVESQLTISHDPALPISQHVDEIRQAIQEHSVIIVAGETGSGKTTQLPKICLAAGRGVDGWIGCTQPRRIAARTIAARLAEEMGVRVGDEVGYQVRFDERVTPESRIKLMTDGVLLAETARDRELLAYDTLIIDEAHERSLNVDFLLGYLKQLLPRRSGLKVIITSATIDTARFAAHFDNAPVIEVSGRSYPVEYRYRPLLDGEAESVDLPTGICQAVDELSRVDSRGDMLVFLPGERDIRESLEALNRHQLKNTEVLPLFARLSSAEQNRIFHPGKARRIILATNVAETSLTVPGIRFVIDSGTARISRYSHRSKVQRLPIEPISQASANQRSGRCGRLGPGVCIRLFPEDEFELRPEFTEPEIVRTNLAAVILKMEVLGLGALEGFPFLDRPDERLVRDGYQLLFELGAMDSKRNIPAIGRELARWPLDVRLGRLILAARDHDCLAEGLVLAAGLSMQDPRERPMDAQGAADEAHKQWQDNESDFVAYLNLWNDWSKARSVHKNRQLRRWCRERFVSYLRMREWSDLRRQLKELADESGWQPNAVAADYEPVHRALLTAFVGQIGLKDDKGYCGARQHRFQLFPGSGLFRSRPAWVMAAFLMETAQVYARVNARVQPEWIESVAAHLVKRRHFDPWWSRRSGKVMGYEQVTLYGIPLIERRRINYGVREPEQARELFIRGALVNAELNSKAPFLDHNRAMVGDVEDLEDRQRRRDLLVDEALLFEFFDRRVPDEMNTAKAFEKWRREVEAGDPEFLFYRETDLMSRSDHGVETEDYPDHIGINGVDLPLSYRLDPGQPGDGVTVHVSLARLNSVTVEPLEWLVPGLRHEKVTALIKSLPKFLRRRFVPAPDVAREFLDQQANTDGSLVKALSNYLTRRSDKPVKPDDFSLESLALHLRFNIAVEDDGTTLAQGRELDELKARWAVEAREEFLTQAGEAFFLDNRQAWDFGELPIQVTLADGAKAYPGLVDQEDAVGVRLFETADEAAGHHRFGLRRLLEIVLRDKFRYLHRSLDVDAKMCLQYASVDSAQELRQDVVFAVSQALVDEPDQPARNETDFQQLCTQVRNTLLLRANELVAILAEALACFHQVRVALSGDIEELYPDAFEDMNDQVNWLVYPGFLTEVPLDNLRHYPRYLTAVVTRIERLERDPGSDRQRQDRLQNFWDGYLALSQDEQADSRTEAFHWLLEEYRVSLFAQQLKTAQPVSAKRIRKAWQRLTGESVG